MSAVFFTTPSSARRDRTPLLALVLAAISPTSLAQTDAGTISGTVKDLSGAPLSGANVQLIAPSDASPASSRTTADGRFEFAALKAGRYSLSVELTGFQKASRENLEVVPQGKTVVDLTLAPDPAPRRPETAARGPGKSNGPPGFYDKPQMKSGELAGSADPGGYSSAGQAERTQRLLVDAAGLKANPGRKARSPSRADELALREIETKLKKELEVDPKGFEPNHDLGEFYIHIGSLPAAIPYLENAYRLNPAHYVNAYDLALVYLETRNYGAARNQVHSMIDRHDAGELHNLLGEVEEKSGNYVKAVQEYERAARMDPSEKHIFDWGTELLLHQTFEPALAVFKTGVERYPDSARLEIGYGIALYSRGLYDESVKAFSRATDLNPSDPHPYLFLAQVYNISNAEAPGVTERLRRFAENEPKNPQALYYYALALWKGDRGRINTGELGQVQVLLKKAATLDPRFPEPHLKLGVLYAERRDYAAAIKEYEQAVHLKSDLADAHYRLGQALVRTGEKVRAQQEFDTYEKLHKEQLTETDAQRAAIRQFVFTMEGNDKP